MLKNLIWIKIVLFCNILLKHLLHVNKNIFHQNDVEVFSFLLLPFCQQAVMCKKPLKSSDVT